MHTQRSEPEQLPAPLREAISSFYEWRSVQLEDEQNRDTIQASIYHYTNVQGLKGIVETGQMWFTDYRHLNDPAELVHGINRTHRLVRDHRARVDDRAGLFLECLLDLFQHENFSDSLEFFVASFSYARDDLSQWRAYADNGQGVAIGFSPSLFTVTDHPLPGHLPEFLGRVRYTDEEVRSRLFIYLEKAEELFLTAANANRELFADRVIGIHFMQEFARELIASPLIWNCLTSKHPAYLNEQEVRLIIMGTPSRLSQHVKTRVRSSEIIPYIAHPMRIRERGQISEIVVGPAAPPGAERTVRTLLKTLGVGLDIGIKHSDIPYRVL